jgi:excisionase family DNA binding protein
MIDNNERLTYNVREAAQALGLSRNSVYQACLKGEIPCVKIGKRILIPKVQLERLLFDDSEIGQVHNG